MRRACSSPIRRLISGYIIGSPTSDNAQWRTCRDEAMSVLANQNSTAHYITNYYQQPAPKYAWLPFMAASDRQAFTGGFARTDGLSCHCLHADNVTEIDVGGMHKWIRACDNHLHALGQAVGLDPGNALELVDHAHVVTQRPPHNLLWAVHLPPPLTANCTPAHVVSITLCN